MFVTICDLDGNMFGAAGQVVGVDRIDGRLTVLERLYGTCLMVTEMLKDGAGLFDGFNRNKDGGQFRHGGVTWNRRLGLCGGMDSNASKTKEIAGDAAFVGKGTAFTTVSEVDEIVVDCDFVIDVNRCTVGEDVVGGKVNIARVGDG